MIDPKLLESFKDHFTPPHIIHVACDELKLVVSTPHEEIVKCLERFEAMDKDELRKLYAGLTSIIVRFSFNRRSRREVKHMMKREPKEYEKLRCDIILYYCARYILLGEKIPSCDPNNLEKIKNDTIDSPMDTNSDSEDSPDDVEDVEDIDR